MIEEWRPIAGYEDLYSVSNTGYVRSEHRVVARKDGRVCTRHERILAPNVNGSGHHSVQLCRGAVGKRRFIHQLVLEAFVGPRPPGMESLHGDGNPANNHVANLRWGTTAENRQDSIRHGTHKETRKTHCPQGHAYDEANTRVNERGHRMCRACNRYKSALFRQSRRERARESTVAS